MAESPSRAHVMAYLGPISILITLFGGGLLVALPDSLAIYGSGILFLGQALSAMTIIAGIVLIAIDIPKVNDVQSEWNPTRLPAALGTLFVAPLYTTWYVYKRRQTFGTWL